MSQLCAKFLTSQILLEHMTAKGTEEPQEIQDAFKVANNPEMRKITLEFIQSLNTRPPHELTAIFRQSHGAYQTKRGIFKDVENRAMFNDAQLLFNKINGHVQEKFCAIYYHYNNAIELQKMVEGYIGQIILKANELGLDRSLTMCLSIQKLKCEYEAFILQCSACLDHFADSIAYSFGFRSNNLDKVEKHLTQLSNKNDKANQIVRILKENEEFCSRLHELLISKTKHQDFFSDWSDRDKITHSGDVNMLPLNIMFNPKTGAKVLHLARKVTGKNDFDLPKITLFMHSFMVDLFRFISEIYKPMFE
jgi:hypothetical protein